MARFMKIQGRGDRVSKMTSKILSNATSMGIKKLEIKEQYEKFISRKLIFIFVSISLIIIIAGIAATLGSYPITVREVYATIWSGLFTTPVTLTMADIVVWNLRLPAILMGIIAGTGLAIAGTMMQGILRNPLASPFTLGISAGAGFGAALAIIFGAGFIGGKWLVIGNAFL
ncbi:iron chelate uptake ABC transporter family permease subunit, partial [candidate division NPL-UPA2 bacterium]|nr:iron chelate uptake ABC transporter family permease subunit [candidate division NPL-UPA2 bacterium]